MNQCFPKPPSSSYGLWLQDNPTHGASPLLMIQISIIVVTTNILRYALRSLGQPAIMSQLLAGILLGPTVLGKLDLFKNVLFASEKMTQLKTVGVCGFLVYMFMIGLKTDLTSIRTIGKQALLIGLAGMLIPLALCMALDTTPLYGFGEVDKYIYADVTFSTTLRWAPSMLIVIFDLLSEKNLLNSKVGRLAIGISVVETLLDTASHIAVNLYFRSSMNMGNTAMQVVSWLAFYSILFGATRPLAYRALRDSTGKPVTDRGHFTDSHFTIFFVLMFVSGILTGVIGLGVGHGAFLLGLVLPSGPPLGSAFVERLESLVSVLFIPVSVALAGLHVDMGLTLSALQEWRYLQFVLMVEMTIKMICILLSAVFFFGVSWNNALALAIVVCSKGLNDASQVFGWIDFGDEESISVLLMFNIIVLAAVPAGFLKVVYRPSARYKGYKRRSIEQTKDSRGIRLLACVHDEIGVPAVITLLETLCTPGAGHVTNTSLKAGETFKYGERPPDAVDIPAEVDVLHLIELAGRVEPIFLQYKHHSKTTESYSTSSTIRIVNAFDGFMERATNSLLSVRHFLAVSPYTGMYEDICTTAVDSKVALVILPFHKTQAEDVVESDNQAIRAANEKVMRYCPCSTAVLIDRGLIKDVAAALGSGLIQTVVVYFLHGADDREALAVALRMAMTNTRVSITMFHILPQDGANVYVSGYNEAEVEAMFDERAVNEFKMEATRNRDLICREEVARSGEDIFSMILSTGTAFDLIVVGKRSGNGWRMLEGLSTWSECPELGVFGDLVANDDAVKQVLSLVVQHPIGGRAR